MKENFQAIVHEAHFVISNAHRPSATIIKDELIKKLEVMDPIHIEPLRTLANQLSEEHANAFEDVLYEALHPVLEVDEESFNVEAKRVMRLKKEAAFAAELYRKAEANLRSLVNGTPYTSEKYAYAFVERKGAVDYKAIPALQGLDVDRWRKPSVRAWTLTELSD